MSKVSIETSTLTSIGNAIRSKTETTDLIAPLDMAEAIEGISGGGTIESKTITANGMYSAPEGVDGYNPITVNVPTTTEKFDVVLEGNCSNLFSAPKTIAMMNLDTITTSSNPITNLSYAFYEFQRGSAIPLFNDKNRELELNCTGSAWYCFMNLQMPIRLKKLTIKAKNFTSIFNNCNPYNSIDFDVDELVLLPSIDISIGYLEGGHIFNKFGSTTGTKINSISIGTNENRMPINANPSIFYYTFYNCNLKEIPNLNIYAQGKTTFGHNQLYNFIYNSAYLKKVNNVYIDLKDLSYFGSTNGSAQYGLLGGVTSLETIGDIEIVCDNVKTNYFTSTFSGDYRLKSIGKIKFPRLDNGLYQWFHNCKSLRELPEGFSDLDLSTTNSNTSYIKAFGFCYGLNEIRNIPVASTVTATSNLFDGTFGTALRVKALTFKLNNGVPYVCNWKNQTISADYTGYVTSQNYSTELHTYIPELDSKRVYNNETYQLYKDDPDWTSGRYLSWDSSSAIAYSRYNKTSALETIASLPDTSAYLASAGGTNTIKFKGSAGSATDGGAINTMTAEEIAVATAKGWTVTFVV